MNNYYYFDGVEAETGPEEEADAEEEEGKEPDTSLEQSVETESRSRTPCILSSTTAQLPGQSSGDCTGRVGPKCAALVPFSRAPTASDREAVDASKVTRTYAQVTGVDQQGSGSDQQSDRSEEQLCPFAFSSSDCPSRSTCRYLHGLFCDLCNRCCLHPFNEKLRRDHREVRTTSV